MNLRRRDGRYLRIGHRGAASLGPANSLEAIEAALTAGLDGIEVDVVAPDDELHVAHSEREWTSESPSLDEALELVARAADRPFVHLDLKVAGYEERLVDAVRAHGLGDRTIVSSFSAPILRAVRAAGPGFSTGFGYPYDRTGLAERVIPAPVVHAGLVAMRRALPRRLPGMLRASEADVMLLHHVLVTPAVAARCRELGVPVWAWTVNDPAALARVDALGVDAVVTDDPSIFGG